MFRCSLLLVPTILAVSTQVATADQSHWVTMDPNAYFNGYLGQDHATGLPHSWTATVPGGPEAPGSAWWSYGPATGYNSPSFGNQHSTNKVNVDNLAEENKNWKTYFNAYYDTTPIAGDTSAHYSSNYSMNGNWDLGNNQDHHLNWGIYSTDFSDFNVSEGTDWTYIGVQLQLYDDNGHLLISKTHNVDYHAGGSTPWQDVGISHSTLHNLGHTSGRLTLDIYIQGATNFMPDWPGGHAKNRAAVWVGIGENVMEIPAPGSLALLGLGGLFARRRRRQA